METKRIADRLLSRLLGAGSALVSVRRRSLAMNGTEQERRALVKQPKLEARVLEILARRGPDDVTMVVARHPALQLETARNLLRIENRAFVTALENRFGVALNLASGNSTAFSEPSVVPVHTDGGFGMPTVEPAAEPGVTDKPGAVQAQLLGSSEAPSGPGMTDGPTAELTAETTEIATAADPAIGVEVDPHSFSVLEPEPSISTLPAAPWVLEDFTSQAPLGTESTHEDTPEAETAQLTDADDELDFLSAVEDFENDLDRLAPLLGQDLTVGSGEPRAQTDRFDEAAEIRLVNAFQRIPGGRTGEQLLAALSQGANAPKFHKLLELYRAGLNVDEVAVAWTVRESWNAANDDKYGISYRSIGAIVRSFAGTPDPDEVLQLLGKLRDNFHLTQVRSTRFFYKYADELAESLEASERAGQYVPLDLLATARNYQ